MSIEFGLGLLKVALPLVAKAIAATVQNKLNPSELERAITAALEESEALKIQQRAWNPVFSRCEPNKIDKFLAKWLEHSAVQGELQKPLQQTGAINVAVVVEAAKQVGNDHGIPIAPAHLKSWLTQFAQAYFDRTSECLRFRVARDNYMTQVANWFDDVKFAGVDVPGYDVEKAEKLAQIFVMPEVEEKPQRGFDSALRLSENEIVIDEVQAVVRHLVPEQRDQSRLERSGRKFVAQQLLSQSVGRAVILGEPGSGKSTLVNYFAVMLALGNGEELGLVGDWLPIVIRMRDWVRFPELPPCEYVRQFAENTLSTKALPVGFFEYWLERGRALILLDGLDEVPEAAKRIEFVQRIENFLGQHSQNRAIVTSRPAGYRRDFFRTEEFPHYELLPF
ncbi:MAG TPA: NACHT domain-containing protein, partial [Thermosynechococcaceae cyanobacterium]